MAYINVERQGRTEKGECLQMSDMTDLLEMLPALPLALKEARV